ncbi:cyclic nucleotide-binding domain protein (macronuclear) [Tetrahymena thermophila SB210]|uniref:Cyclic nucleotide-binding domain protein n=1 Tax=Tetrahymena thermophila (strain SB210) TaxID=312017 RepID=I7M0C2_TETTS|nr:cyclic nucleotide-binding domain protein [Tetrahymena thermophila SB210]EAR87296.2 cyclic nucleotide-binding domain protein [Tetrahymena thermophila SB210]|eukprot:XP_001007541.2 cyclic nucleotide-binding domain protein [Tetrahymena thermophila SB210]
MKQILRIKLSDQICDKKVSNSQPKNNLELMPIMSPRTSKLQTPVSAFLGSRSQHAQISGFSYHLEQEEPINEEFCFTNDDDLSIAIQILNKDPYKRSQREIKLIQQAIKKTSLYEYYKPFLDEEQRFNKLCMRLQYFYFNPYQEIISYGESPRKMYIMMKGSAWVLVPSSQKDKEVEKRVKEKITQAQQLGSTDIYCFVKAEDYILFKNPNYKIVNQIEGPTHIGDQALRYRCNRTSSIFSKTTVHLASLDLKDFNEIFMQFDYKMINYYYPHYQVIQMFKKNDLFSKFDDSVVESIVRSSDKVNICRSQIIYNQGDKNDYLYFIEEGEVELKQKNINNSDNQQEIFIDPSKLIQQIEMEQKVALLSNNCRRKYRDSFQKTETFRYIAVLSKGEIFGEDFIESTERKYQAVCKSVQVSLYRIRITVFMKYFEQIGKNQKAMLQTKQQWRAQLQNTTKQVQSQFDLSNKFDKQELEEIKKKSTQFIYFDAYEEDPNSKFLFNKNSQINSYNNPQMLNQNTESPQNIQNDQTSDQGNLSARKTLSYFNKSNFLSQKCLINTSDESFSKSTGYEEGNYFNNSIKANRTSIKLQNHLNKLSSDTLSMREIQSKARNRFSKNDNHNLEDEPSIMRQLNEINTSSNSIDRGRGSKFSQTVDNIFQNLQQNPKQLQKEQELKDSIYFVGTDFKVPQQQQVQSFQFTNKIETSQFLQKKTQRDSISSESQKSVTTQQSTNKLQTQVQAKNQDSIQNLKRAKQFSLIALNQKSNQNDKIIKRQSQTNQGFIVKTQKNSIELKQLDLKEIQSKQVQNEAQENALMSTERSNSCQKMERSESVKLRLSISKLAKNRSAVSHIPTSTLGKFDFNQASNKRSASPCFTEYEDDNIKENNQKQTSLHSNKYFHYYKFNDAITEEKQKREAIVINNEFYLNQIARKMKKILDTKLRQKKEQHFNPFNLTEDHSVPLLKQLKIDEIFPNSEFADQTKKGIKNINKILQDGHAHLLEESNFVRIKKKLPTMMNEQISKDDVLDIAGPHTKKDQKLENIIQSQLNNQDSRLYIKLLLEKIQRQQNKTDPNLYNFIPLSDSRRIKRIQEYQKTKQNENIKNQ